MMTLEMVGADALDLVWKDYGVGELFAEQEWRASGQWTAKTAYEQLKNETMWLWLVLEDRQNIKAALLTQMSVYETGAKVCTVLMVVGKESRSWVGLVSVLEDWARDSGCESIEAIGRIGWKRITPWKATSMIFEKRLV